MMRDLHCLLSSPIVLKSRIKKRQFKVRQLAMQRYKESDREFQPSSVRVHSDGTCVRIFEGTCNINDLHTGYVGVGVSVFTCCCCLPWRFWNKIYTPTALKASAKKSGKENRPGQKVNKGS